MSHRVQTRNHISPRSIRALVFAATIALLAASSSSALAWQSSLDPIADQAAYAGPTLVHGSFSTLRIVSPEEPKTETLSAPETRPLLGQVISNTAMGYIGYPYLAAGAGPGGFDCSGFSQFIVGITTGIWIPHAVEAQPYNAGSWVNWGEWLPGDLIYFQNTYRAGISHVGIYIGDGLIVHAENEGSGVTVDSIYSSYYGPRYWGAVRVG